MRSSNVDVVPGGEVDCRRTSFSDSGKDVHLVVIYIEVLEYIEGNTKQRIRKVENWLQKANYGSVF